MSNAKIIWDYLREHDINEFGTSGIMGNLYAESALSPINLQNSYERSLGMTDAQYTAAVDNGTYTNFVHDAAGYGLAQWTYWSRKEGLLKLAKAMGKSIGDINVQLLYLYSELKQISGFNQYVKNATSVQQASDFILLNYERPLDQSQSMKNVRASCGMKYYNEFAGASSTSDTSSSNAQTTSAPAYTGVMIGHASIDENGKAHGGQAGDQTGKEVCIRTWYDGKWDRLIRAKDPAVAEKMARFVEIVCNSNLVGYDQYQRNTLRDVARAAGWDANKITTKCETDCSAFMTVAAEAAGISIPYMEGWNAPVTSTMCNAFKNTGAFDVLSGAQYCSQTNYLKRGDILVRQSGHTAMVLSNGALASNHSATTTVTTHTNPYTAPIITVKQGSRGTAVKWVQFALYKAGYGVGSLDSFVDGDFGPNTKNAVMKFQAANNLEVDGIVGPITRNALKKV